MATIGNSVLTLADWSKRRDPSGKTAKIIEVLEERNPVLQDAVYVEGNLPTGHRTTIRTSLPTGTWRQINTGVAVEKSTTRQVTDTIGMLETYSECDKKLADLSGNTNSFRWSEDLAFLSGLGNESARCVFYGDTADVPEEPHGLTPRYNTASSDYFIAGGGSGTDNRSIWLITWGPNTCHLIFPKGSTAGIQSEDKGQVTLTDATTAAPNTSQYEGYRTWYANHFGVCLRDERSVVRIGNIDESSMVGGEDPGLLRFLIRALNVVKGAAGRRVFYAPESVRTWLDIHREEKSNLSLSLINWAGEPTTAIWGVPIRICDTLERDEALVS